MKKFISIFLVVIMCLSLFACTKNEKAKGEKKEKETTVVSQKDSETSTETENNTDDRTIGDETEAGDVKNEETEPVSKDTEKNDKQELSKTPAKESETVTEAETFPIKRDPKKADMPSEITFASARISMLGKTTNIELEVANNSDKDIDFDFGYVVVKINGKEVRDVFSVLKIPAKRSIKCSFPIKDPDVKISIGDKTEIYYGKTKITTGTVESFIKN